MKMINDIIEIVMVYFDDPQKDILRIETGVKTLQ